MVLAIYCLVLVGLSSLSWSTPQDGFCYNVKQMHRHCVNQSSEIPASRPGKSGPRGPKGEKGEPGIVDREDFDLQIEDEIAEVKNDLNAKFSQCQQSLQRAHERIDQLEEKIRGIVYTDCRKVALEDATWSDENGGIFDIYISGKKVEVYCDVMTDGGGWMVFQRRISGSVNFYRGWTEYVTGFGTKSGEFWLGLETLHQITSGGKYELRVDLEDWEGNRRYARYTTFRIGDEASDYQLTISGYSGTASDSMSRESGRAFTTKDSDHDTSGENCAVLYKGGWWYGSCHEANLNGLYHKGGTHSSYADGINWRHWKGYYYSMKFAEMKIRLLLN